METKRLAAIDIGTNTFRLLIAEISRDAVEKKYSIKEIHSERIITRLGEGIPDNGRISEQAFSRSIEALVKFSESVSGFDVFKTAAVATSALRDGENSDDFLFKAREASGFDIEVIKGSEEARITAAGMLLDIVNHDRAFMVDIGGGSTELICATDGRDTLNVRSLNLGVVYLAGKYMVDDPPLLSELKLMEEEIADVLHTSYHYFRPLLDPDTVFIGTAGTVTALASISQGLTSYDHNKIHKYKLTREKVKDLFSLVSSSTSEERAAYIPFEPSRLDIIVPGTLILFKLMDLYGFNEITVSNHGLREGILVDLYEKLS